MDTQEQVYILGEAFRRSHRALTADGAEGW